MSRIEAGREGGPPDENELFRQDFERKIRAKHPDWGDEQVNWLVDAGEVAKIVEEYEKLRRDPSISPDQIGQKFQEVTKKQEAFWEKYE